MSAAKLAEIDTRIGATVAGIGAATAKLTSQVTIGGEVQCPLHSPSVALLAFGEASTHVEMIAVLAVSAGCRGLW
jgi:hypothetical protein